MEEYLSFRPDETFGDGDLRQIAEDDLIMNAGLKLYAQNNCGGATLSYDDMANPQTPCIR